MSPIQGFLEVVDIPIYDTIHTMAPRHEGKGNRQQLFQLPIGMAHDTKKGLLTKTEADTNLVQPGCIENPHSLEIRNIRLALIGRRLFPVDSRYFLDTHVRFDVNRKTMWEGPAWKCADPAAIWIASDLSQFLKEDFTEMIKSLRKPIDPPIILHSHEHFSATITYGDAWYDRWYAVPSKIVLLLEGQLSRASM